jgi:hypothetical protein
VTSKTNTTMKSPCSSGAAQRIWEVDARTEIQDFAEETGIDLELSDEDSEFDTLGGMAYALAGRVPVRGEILRSIRPASRLKSSMPMPAASGACVSGRPNLCPRPSRRSRPK